MSKNTKVIIIILVVIFGGYFIISRATNLYSSPNNTTLTKVNNKSGNTVQQAPYFGEKGTSVSLVNGKLSINESDISGNIAHYYNTQLSSGKTVYFFIVKDRTGVYRAAANACQVCFDAKMGFRQEGDYMVCNTCGNKYPLEKIATEKGGCNPGPINPNVPVSNGKLIINEGELLEVANFF